MSLHFVLDGYNLIKQHARLHQLKLQAGREAFLAMIDRDNLLGSARNTATIVFDGQVESAEIRQGSGITLIYSGYGAADERIKRLIEDARNPKSCVVVTDDREIQFFVRALGARIMSTKEFFDRRHLSKGPESKTPKTAAHDSERKPASDVWQGKITSEMKEVWLKKEK